MDGLLKQNMPESLELLEANISHGGSSWVRENASTLPVFSLRVFLCSGRHWS